MLIELIALIKRDFLNEAKITEFDTKESFKFPNQLCFLWSLNHTMFIEVTGILNCWFYFIRFWNAEKIFQPCSWHHMCIFMICVYDEVFILNAHCFSLVTSAWWELLLELKYRKPAIAKLKFFISPSSYSCTISCAQMYVVYIFLLPGNYKSWK